MQIYLAGGITGNLFPMWKNRGGQNESIDFKRVMDIYLVNPTSRPYTIENNDYLLGRGTSREERNNNAGANAEQNRTDDNYP